MSEASEADITRLLRDSAQGQPSGALLEAVYEQLRRIAQQRMSQERRDHTLQATALVHEAYLRLAAQANVDWASRGHFYSAAAEAMRRILIEHARARARLKRGGNREGRRPLGRPLSVLDLAQEHDPAEILTLDEAIRRLGEQDAEAALVVRLRFFAGLSVDETARVLGVSASTVDREWAFARAWLHRALGDDEAGMA